MKRTFKYYPKSFGELTVKVLHMDLIFDMYEDRTVVESTLTAKALKNVKNLDLNAKKLEILEVSLSNGDCKFKYIEKEDILRVKFKKTVKKGDEFSIKTKTICRPTKHVLEGLYYDETPKGCPCQQITQCQQWGFQRIVPCIDDMTAKCTYNTTIIADARYTNLISNGDVSQKIKKVGEDRMMIKYENVITPMATYLFFLGAGTYATFKKEFEYPNGDKFMLELLVPPESDAKIAQQALQVLNDAIMWVYLFTGPDKYKNREQALKVKALIERRDAGENVAKELKAAAENRTWGYKYTGTVYREIGMQNSDFGGMENVGNTTITTNRIMPFPEMTDGSFEYMIKVKVHEFYHNLNGSEVTGRSPFEIWLNEAVTVFIEREYSEFLFGQDYGRLDEVLTFLAPGGGTFAMDDNVASMPIEPDGFNDCNELITGVTYVKAPEFVRMIQTLMGRDTFVKGLDLYHRRYKHGNASRAQWVEAMEEASGLKLQKMAQAWLKQSSYPKVYISSSWNDGKFVMKLEQKGFKKGMHWEFPFDFALCDADGREIWQQITRIDKVKQEFVIKGVSKPAFLSLNRDYGFFGKVFYQCSEEELYLQVNNDKDMVNRYMAFYRLAEAEKMRLLENKKAQVSERFRDLYFSILSNEKLMAEVGSAMLTLFQQVEDQKYAHAYQELYDVVKKIQKAVAERYETELLEIYQKYSTKEFSGTYVQIQVGKIKARQVKNAALALLSELDVAEVHKLIKKQFTAADCATDKVVAFSLYINSSAADKMKLLDQYQKVAQKNLVSWESFLSCVAGNNSKDALDIIRKVEESKSFRIEQANDQRALYCRFAMNRKRSLLTAEGRKYLRESLLKLAPINEYSAGHMLNVFGNIDQIDRKHRAPLVRVLMEVKEKLDRDELPSVVNTIERILAGSPKGVKEAKK